MYPNEVITTKKQPENNSKTKTIIDIDFQNITIKILLNQTNHCVYSKKDAYILHPFSNSLRSSPINLK